MILIICISKRFLIQATYIQTNKRHVGSTGLKILIFWSKIVVEQI